MMFYFGPRDPVMEEIYKKGGVTALSHLVAVQDGENKVKAELLIKGKTAESEKFFGPVDPSDKDPIELGDYLTESETYITVWANTTSKKPVSMKQEIALAPRAYLNYGTIETTKGKVNLGKTLEVYDTTKQKYGKLPKATANVTAAIRLKNTAKAGSADKAAATLGFEGTAASREGTVTAVYGEYEPPKKEGGKGKNGFTSCTITAPAYAGRVALVNPRLVKNTDTLTKLFMDTTDVKLFYDIITEDTIDTGDITEDDHQLECLALADPAATDPAGHIALLGNHYVAAGANQGDPQTLYMTVLPKRAGIVKIHVTDATKYTAADQTLYVEPFEFEVAKHLIEVSYAENQGDKTKIDVTVKLDGKDTIQSDFQSGILKNVLQYTVTDSEGTVKTAATSITAATTSITKAAATNEEEKYTITVTIVQAGQATLEIAKDNEAFEYTVPATGS